MAGQEITGVVVETLETQAPGISLTSVVVETLETQAPGISLTSVVVETAEYTPAAAPLSGTGFMFLLLNG